MGRLRPTVHVVDHILGIAVVGSDDRRVPVGIESFDELAELAGRGDRRNVDLLVGDINPEGGISLHPDLNASSFAKLASRDPADLAHALMGLVGENVGIICTVIAQSAGIRAVVFGGNRGQCVGL